MNRLITVENIKKRLKNDNMVCLKYVRTKEEFVFAETDGQWFPPDHSTMVNKEQRKNVVSAAYIEIRYGKLEIDGRSSTLETGRAADDEEKLIELFGL